MTKDIKIEVVEGIIDPIIPLVINSINSVSDSQLTKDNQNQSTAEVVRNDEGKVTSVILHMPDSVTDNEHSNAMGALAKTPGVSSVTPMLIAVLTKSFENDVVGQLPTSSSGETYIADVAAYPNSTIQITDESAPTGLTKSLKISSTSGIAGFAISILDFSLNAELEFYISKGNSSGALIYNIISGLRYDVDGTLSLAETVLGSFPSGWHKINVKYNVVNGNDPVTITIDDAITQVIAGPWSVTEGYILPMLAYTNDGSPCAIYLANIKYSKI